MTKKAGRPKGSKKKPAEMSLDLKAAIVTIGLAMLGLVELVCSGGGLPYYVEYDTDDDGARNA